MSAAPAVPLVHGSARSSRRPRRPRRSWARTVAVSAWAVPVMVVGQFAMLAIVPVALVVAGTLRDPRLRRLRRGAVALAVVYAVPLVMWAVGPDRAPSLSKDMHPVLVPVLAAAGAAFVVAFHVVRRRARFERATRTSRSSPASSPHPHAVLADVREAGGQGVREI